MLFILFISTFFVIPIVALIAGICMRVDPPQRIGFFFGYRSIMSMKNEETWAYAHKEISKYLIIAGISTLLVTLAIVLIILLKDIPFDSIPLTYAIMIPQLFVLLGGILYTEVKLHRKFNKDGTLIN